MIDSFLYFGSTLLMLIMILLSYALIKKTKGKLTESLKIMVFGHIPLTLIHFVKAVFALYEYRIINNLTFFEQISYTIAAISIFLALYKIKNIISDEEYGRKKE